MPASLADQIATQAEAARSLYHRLVIVVGGARSGKTTAFKQLAERQAWPLVNLNLTLAERLLELTSRQRALQAAEVVGDIFSAIPGDVLLLDNTEMLFHPELKLDPLRLFQSLSRNRTLVVSWKGAATEHELTFAAPDHSEYRRYQKLEMPVVIAHSSSALHPGGATQTQRERIA